MNKKGRGIGRFSTLIIVLFVLGLYYVVGQMAMQQQSYTYEDFIEAVEQGEVQSVVIEQDKAVPTGTLEVTLESGDSKYVNVSDVNEAQEILKQAGITDIEVLAVPQDSVFLTSILPTLLMVGALIFVFMMMNRPTGANAKAMNFGRNRAKMMNPSDKHITFANVAGLHEEKEELEEIVDFLKSPKKYIQVGARIPKGVLLVGPPGTGKPCLQRRLQERRVFRSLPFPVRILWKCLLVWVLLVSETCLRKRRKMHHVLYLSMRLMLWRDVVEPDSVAVTMKESRHSTNFL